MDGRSLPRSPCLVSETILFGRDREVRVIEELLDGVGDRGGTLVILSEGA
jgi:hypothetical protein